MPDFLHQTWVQIIIAIILALVPVLIWMNVLFLKHEASKAALIKVFLFGTLTVIPILGFQYFFIHYFNFDVYYEIEHSVKYVALGHLLTFVAVGVFEEIAKFNMLRHLKWAKIEIQSINDAMRYILLIALGFAFSENILYFWQIWGADIAIYGSEQARVGALFHAFVFRSIFTAAAHMTFSSIVAYYYAIGKFGNPIMELDRWTGKRHVFAEWIQKTFGIQGKNIFHIQKTLQGLLLAMGLHALFNFSLQMNRLGYALMLVVFGFVMIVYLRKKRTTYLVFTDQEKTRPSTIGKPEENVVIELMGMWLNEGKYKEVIEICDRLGQRDPDNLVIKLFRAKAADRKKIDRVKKAIHMLFTDEEYDVKKEEMSLFERLKQTQQKKEELFCAWKPKGVS